MKKSILTILMLCSAIMVFAEWYTYDAIGTNKLRVGTNVRVGDMWGDNWNNKDYKIATTLTTNTFVITLFSRNDEAWNYYCKINLKDFSIPDKKVRRTYQKNDKWFKYDCDVEFYYNVEYPSIEECFANYGGFAVNSKNKEAKKRKVEGSIQLNPYFFTAGEDIGDNDDEKMVVNLFFDEVGYAIYFLDHLKFPNK